MDLKDVATIFLFTTLLIRIGFHAELAKEKYQIKQKEIMLYSH